MSSRGTKEENIFDNILGLGNDDNRPDDGTSESEPNKKEKNSEDKERLEKSYKDLQEHARQQSEELKKMRDKVDKIDKIESVFSGEDRKKEQEELSEREEFERDQFFFTKKQFDEHNKKLRREIIEEVNKNIMPIKANNVYEQCKSKILKKYFVDFDDPKTDKMIAEKLEMVSDKLKNADPEKALIMAAHLAGALKKREASDLPFIEQSRAFMAFNPKAIQKEADRIKDSIIKAGKPAFKL